MKKLLDKVIELEDKYTDSSQSEDTYPNTIDGVRIGKLISIKTTGPIFVDYHDNSFGPLRAKSIIDIGPEDINKKVLLAFEAGYPHFSS